MGNSLCNIKKKFSRLLNRCLVFVHILNSSLEFFIAGDSEREIVNAKQSIHLPSWFSVVKDYKHERASIKRPGDLHGNL